MRLPLLQWVFLFAALPAFAEDEVVHEACARFERETTTANLGLCQLAEFRESDREMNRRYQELVRALRRQPGSEQIVGAAQSAQRSWLAFRDRTCELESLRLGFAREYHPPVCLMVVTKARSEELVRYAACVGHDQTCDLQ